MSGCSPIPNQYEFIGLRLKHLGSDLRLLVGGEGKGVEGMAL